MSDSSLPSDQTPSPAMVRAESGRVKSEPASPKAGQAGSQDDLNGTPSGAGRSTPPVQNGFHGSGSDSDSGVDAPLDFSLKSSRNRISEGSEGDSSDSYVKRLKREPLDGMNFHSNSPTTSPPNDGRHGGVSGGISNGDDSNKNGIKLQDKIGEPPTALPGILPGAAGAAMPGLIPNAAMFANLPLYMDPRRLQQLQQQMQNTGGSSPAGNTSKSSARPFKAYPKDPLSLPLGFYGLPGMLPFPSIDTVSAQAMNMSSEEMFNQYRNYVMRVQQDQGKGNKGTSSPKQTLQQQQEQQRHFEQVSQQLELHKKQQLLQQQLQQQQQQQQMQQKQVQQPTTSQPSPSGISETSTTARSISSSPTSSCTTPIPTSPNGNETAARPATGNGNGEAATSTNISLGSGPVTGATTPSRKRGRILPEEQKDEAYWERRRKNNEAAKRSRDSRRAKEDEIAIRAAFLEQENLKLRVEVAALKNETAKLRCMLYNS